MSYSRWSNSYWYTFWRDTGTDKRSEQVFDVDCRFCFTYKQLTSLFGIEKAINHIKKEIKNSKVKATKADFNELKGYMRKFIHNMRCDERDLHD